MASLALKPLFNPLSCSSSIRLSRANVAPRTQSPTMWVPSTGLRSAAGSVTLPASSSPFLGESRLTGLGLGLGLRKRSKVPHASAAASGAGDAESKAVAPAPPQTASTAKLAVIFGLWYFFNVVFNIYNKKVLNVFPMPWLTSCLSLLAGSLFMCIAWLTGAQKYTPVDRKMLTALAPVALFHTIGHVAATVSMSKVAVSFTHIIKSSEPALSVLIQSLFMGVAFPTAVYLSLIPIVGGCAIAATTELSFNWGGFWGAMISNLAFVFRNIYSKKQMNAVKELDAINTYAWISIIALLYLTPVTLLIEGPQWAAGWEAAKQILPAKQLLLWMGAQSLFYHLYNQVSYMALGNISPLTFSIGNTMKRVVVIISSVIAFRNPVSPANAAGSAIAILGTFFYSQTTAKKPAKKA